MLQQLWNKIFHRCIIEKYHIRFDETQRMGEDFQFVLDYIEAAKIHNCIVLNEALYYYIRECTASLMSQFGIQAYNKAYMRLDKLFKLCGKSEEVKQRYNIAIEKLCENYAYHVVNSKKIKSHKKRSTLEQLYGTKLAKQKYLCYKTSRYKEKLIASIATIKHIPARVYGILYRQKQLIEIEQIKSSFKAARMTILSQNCIGGVFYHDMGLRFSSPTIDLFIPQPDFVRFVLNLTYYLNLSLEISWGEEWPIGMLGDVHIEFMHYDSCSIAKESWNKRIQRIDLNRIIVLSTDRNGFDDAVFSQWQMIPYPKVLFTVQEKFTTDEGTILFPEYKENGVVPDLIPKREFYKDGKLIAILNKASKD